MPVERGTKAGNLFTGSMRVLSDEEKAFIAGTTPAKKPKARQGTPIPAADPSESLVPDGQGGFKKAVEPQPAADDGQPPLPVPARIVPDTSDKEGVIRINDEKRKVTITCKGKFMLCGADDYGKASEFSVCVEAASVDVSENGVSLLIRGDAVINPPTMVMMTITVDGVQHNVTYTGGRHRLGNYVNMPFARI